MSFKCVLVTIGICLIMLANLAGQNSSPYHFSFKREMLFGGAALGTSLTGFAMHQGVKPIELNALQLPKISRFDAIAPDVLNIAPSDASDVLLFSAIALPSLFLTAKTSKKDIMSIGVLYVEAMLLNAGITDIVKTLSLRPRPYTHNLTLDPTTIIERNDRSSFFSGHTSVTATASFFCARVFADYYPDSRFKPYLWTSAAILPAVTAYLRVRAGKHYPSDVLTGYLIGGAIGYLIPELHKRPVSGRQLNFSLGFGGMNLQYRF